MKKGRDSGKCYTKGNTKEISVIFQQRWLPLARCCELNEVLTLRPMPLVDRIVGLTLSAAVFAIVVFAPEVPLTFQGKRQGPS
jgi:hypothetical protein